ncbi:MAG: pyruvate ferredoxin oxidoreductase, partial [Deltaproteobacteria bacterium]|nr:pyruvate ferredoxin oxidoreductase [Deltaproteobacteria bacterium]
MIEIKFRGRGGQGAVVASEILGRAFFLEGKYPQSFSLFGSERRGAPVFG